MKIIRSLNEADSPRKSICTVGSFDGVHLAHQAIIGEVTERSGLHGMRSVVCTFDPHPKEVVHSNKGPVELLTTLDERIARFEKLRIDCLFIIPFTYEFSRLPARNFYRRYIVDGISAAEVVVGYDHMFGRDRESGIRELVGYGTEFGFGVHTVPPYRVDETIVNSSKIRTLLAEGLVDKAAKLLGWNYSVSGTVVPGEGRGRNIGFPTANIEPGHEKKLIPGNGVYYIHGDVDGEIVPGMLNVGVRPTFYSNGRRTIEAHFFGQPGDLYGKVLTIEFIRKIRNEVSFNSPQELIERLHRDKEFCLKITSQP